MTPSTISEYGKFCRPNLEAQLKSLRLDLHYHRGEGNYLYYRRQGREARVTDFLGGFGSLMFGHSHPELVKTLCSATTAQLPFAAQASQRAGAGKLAAELNRLLRKRLGEDYLTLFSNSGTEAVEVAIKHSLYHSYHRLHNQVNEISAYLKRLASKHNYLDAIDFSVKAFLAEYFEDVAPVTTLSAIMERVKSVNERLLGHWPVLIAIEKAFHGKTLGSIQLTHNPDYKKEFPALSMGIRHIPLGDFDSLAEALAANRMDFFSLTVENRVLKLKKHPETLVAAFLVEPIQGEGGMRVVPAEFMQAAARLCREQGVPLIIDEIQTGIGRTGTFLFSEQLGVVPDYVILSKSLGGGLTKIGATLVARRIFGDGFDLIQSSTFAEDEFSASVARRSLQLLTDDPAFLENVNQRGLQLQAGLRSIRDNYPTIIQEVRGAGLMLGLVLAPQTSSGSNCLRLMDQQGLLGYLASGFLLHEAGIRTFPCLSDKRVLRIEPSGYITKSDCDHLLSAIYRLCRVLSHQNMFELCKFLVDRPSSSFDKAITCYRKPDFRPGDQRYDNRVAFIGHFIQATDMINWDGSLEQFSEDELEILLESIYPLITPFVSDSRFIRSANGRQIRFDMLGFVITSKIISRHMEQRDLQPLVNKIKDCLQLAEANGCAVVGFGGFSSIITGNCRNLPEMKTAFTTGNSFTTAMGLEAMFSQAPEMGIDPVHSTFAAVGAAGNIASVYCEYMARHVRRIILLGAKGRLERIHALAQRIFDQALSELKKSGVSEAGIGRALLRSRRVKEAIEHNRTITSLSSFYEQVRGELGDDFPIYVSDDMSLLAQAELVLSATNSPEPVIFPEMLGIHPTLICDIAVPFDADASLQALPGVHVIKGGIVRVPGAPDFHIPGILLPKGTAYACMSETMLLGLEGVSKHFSYGDISLEQVDDIQRLAAKHGFLLDQPKIEASY